LASRLISEVTIEYDSKQKEYYRNDDLRCIYPLWKKRYGIHNAGGNFPAMVARHHYEKQWYLVEDDFCLIRKPKQRESNEGYRVICEIFGEQKVRKVIKESERALFACGMGRGGDPDLFVFRKDYSESFFVEAKEPPDKLRPNQKIVIPIIMRYLCPVILANIIER